MISSHIRTVLRNLKRHLGYMMLNVGGLAVGLATCIVILLFVQSEMSVDTWHEKADRIVRVWSETRLGPTPDHSGHTAHPLADFAEENFPQIETSTRILSSLGTSLVRRGDRFFYEDEILAMDPEFFHIFDIRFIEGTPETALSEPYSVVLTPSFAERYFGEDDPIGQEVTITFWGQQLPFTVTGIVEPPPANTRFQYEAVISYETYVQYNTDNYASDITDHWGSTNPETFLLLREDADWRALEELLSPAVTDYVTSEEGGGKAREDVWYTYFLQPLTDVHLGRLGLQVEAEDDLQTIRMFSAIAVLILLIACANYMNLATARGARRAREVGVRKVFGARRSQLAGQFMAEAVVLTALALVAAVLLVEAAVPLVNDAASERVITGAWYDLRSVGWLVGLALAAGVISGSYPAFVMTRFRPVSVLRSGGRTTSTGSSLLRKTLVVAQFTGGIALIIATTVVWRQMEYVHSMDLGYEQDQVVSVPLRSADSQNRYEVIRERMSAVNGVQVASASSELPTGIGQGHTVKALGNPEDDGTIRSVLAVDAFYDDALDLQIKAGRWFEMDRPADNDAYVINEAAVREFGLTDPIGTEIDRNGAVGPIIGIVRDYHHASLHEEIQPLVIYRGQQRWDRRTLVMRLAGEDLEGTLSGIREVWSEVSPGEPFTYSFLDDEIGDMYRSEQRLGRLFALFAGLGVFVACLGLFGLAAFTAQERTKEIGVRKVLGATLSSVVLLLSRDFVKLVALAFCVAAPLAWIAMNQWLDGFAYHLEIDVWMLAVPALLAFVIAVFTVSGQAIRAGLANPVNCLRTE